MLRGAASQRRRTRWATPPPRLRPPWPPSCRRGWSTGRAPSTAGPAGPRRAARPRARPGRGPRARSGLRRVPDGPPPGRGRPRPAPAPGDAGPRGRRRGRPARRRQHPVGGWATGSGCPGWPTPAASAASACPGRENLCPDPRFTGWDVDGGYADYAVVDEAYAYALPDGIRRSGGRAAALCRDHRLPGPAAGQPSRGGPARDLRVRGLRPPHGPGGAGPGRPRPCHDPLARGTGAGPPARRGQRRGRRRRAAGALDSAILFAPVGTLVPPALAALDRGGTLAVAGIYLERRPRPGLPAAPLRGADPAERDGQHPARRGGLPRRGGPDPVCGSRPSPTPWTAPTPRCATSGTTASTAPPSSSSEGIRPL